MTLKELRDIYEGSSGTASDMNRKLIFAGIAIVWIFRDATKLSSDKAQEAVFDAVNNAGELIPDAFKPILLLFCISLCFDVFQSLIRGVMWHVIYHFKRDPQKKEEEILVEEQEWMNAFPDSLWYAKYVPTILAYLKLAGLLSITTFGKWAWLQNIGGMSIIRIWLLILGFLLVWYAVLEWLPMVDVQKTSKLCSCIRFAVGMFILIISLLSIL